MGRGWQYCTNVQFPKFENYVVTVYENTFFFFKEIQTELFRWEKAKCPFFSQMVQVRVGAMKRQINKEVDNERQKQMEQHVNNR